jgi:class 3 adenylate cyclase/tetratricopeptide (TPR) repeat protein
VVDLEGLARAGQIAVGPNAAKQLPARNRGATVGPDGAVLVRGVPPRPTGMVFEPVTPDQDEQGIPTALRPHLGRVDGEHRQAAVAFVQVNGLDALIEREGAEAAAKAMHETVVAAQSACADHGVTFLSTDVDIDAAKLILVTGAPTTLADDEDRLVSACRSILAAELPLPVRIGAHRGRVFAVEVGDADRRVYTVLGDAVNIAARVMPAAPVGRLLATPACLDRVVAAYAREPVEPFAVKGKSEPIQAALVGPIEQVAETVVAATDGPLIGREEELRVLLDAVARARAGHRSVVELVGEPGIGKSRLLAEACAQVGELPLVVVQARQYASTEPYRAVRDPLRRLLGVPASDTEAHIAEVLAARVREHVPDLEPLLPLVGVPFGVHLPDTEATAGLAPDYRRSQLSAATFRLLGRLLPTTGVLVIEDAYWLDDGSGQLLATLIGAMRGDHHWAVFVARRGLGKTLDLSEVHDLVRLELRALPANDAIALAQAGGLSPADAEVLVERSGGNPLFLRELAAAAERGTAVDELPDNVEAVIAAHLDTLDVRARDLVRVASVLGSHFPTDLLLKLDGDSREHVLSALRRLRGIVDPDGSDRCRFAHAMLREGAYNGLSFRRRRQLHGRAGDLIKAYDDDTVERRAAALSLHYHAAGRHQDSWQWSRRAGEQAQRDAAPVEAVALFSRALDSARPAGVGAAEVAALTERLGDVAELGGLFQQAQDAYRRARRLRSGDPVVAGDLLRKQGHVAEREGRYSFALRLYGRGFRALEQATPSTNADRVKAELTLAYGATRLRQGRYSDAVRVLEEAVHHAEALSDRAVLAHGYYLLDWARTDLGDPDPSLRAMALPIYEELGDWLGQGNVLNNLGVDAYYEGDWTEATEYYRRSQEAFQRVGHAVLAATARNNVGEILSDQGHLEQAKREFQQALGVWQLANYSIGVGIATSNLGRAAARSGDLDAAAGLLARARSELTRIGADSLAIEAEGREAERLLFVPAPEEALAVALHARARTDQPVQRAFLDRTIGWALAQQGLADDAVAKLEESLAAAVASSTPYEEALTRLALARITSSDERAASEILTRLGVVTVPSPPLPA